MDDEARRKRAKRNGLRDTIALIAAILILAGLVFLALHAHHVAPGENCGPNTPGAPAC